MHGNMVTTTAIMFRTEFQIPITLFGPFHWTAVELTFFHVVLPAAGKVVMLCTQGLIWTRQTVVSVLCLVATWQRVEDSRNQDGPSLGHTLVWNRSYVTVSMNNAPRLRQHRSIWIGVKNL
jgi:hypothetical protein